MHKKHGEKPQKCGPKAGRYTAISINGTEKTVTAVSKAEARRIFVKSFGQGMYKWVRERTNDE